MGHLLEPTGPVSARLLKEAVSLSFPPISARQMPSFQLLATWMAFKDDVDNDDDEENIVRHFVQFIGLSAF